MDLSNYRLLCNIPFLTTPAAMLHWHNMLFVVIWCVLWLTKVPQSNQQNMKQKLKLKWSRKKWGQAFFDLKSRTQLITWWPSPHLTINTGKSEWLALVKTQPCRKNPQLLLWGALRHLYAKRDAGWGYLNIRAQHVYCWYLNTSGSSTYYSFTILQCQTAGSQDDQTVYGVRRGKS